MGFQSQAADTPLAAQVKGIPFVVFDVGGVLEMFDQESNQAAVILKPSIKSLYGKLKSEPSCTSDSA